MAVLHRWLIHIDADHGNSEPTLSKCYTGFCMRALLHMDWRDNFRMYYFNLLFTNFRAGRSHALSHHMFPNSLLDMKLMAPEPLMIKKNLDATLFSTSSSAVYVSFNFFLWHFNKVREFFEYFMLSKSTHFPNIQTVIRIVLVITKRDVQSKDVFIPFVVPLTMFVFGGGHTILDILKIYIIMLVFSGIIFGIIAIRVGHHHPEVFHDGDPVR